VLAISQIAAHVRPFLILPILLATISENAIDVLQELGAIFWMILITLLLAEHFSNSISRWRSYPALIFIDLVLLILLGLNKPFDGYFGVFLTWSALCVPLYSWALLTAIYLEEKHGMPRVETYLVLVLPAVILLTCLFWWLLRT
jgi:hypothetical protein